MTPQQLIRKIRALPARAPHAEALEQLLLKKPRWYANQKEHWLGWLAEYETPGAYDRKLFDHDAAFAYAHCGCPPMVLWLGEAAGVKRAAVLRALNGVARSDGTFSSKCAIIRREITWAAIESCLHRA